MGIRTLLITAIFLLNACTPYVNPPLAPVGKNSILGGEHGGTILGAIGTAGGVAVPGAVAGAAIGAGMQSYLVSTYRMLEILQRQGVQVVQVGRHLRVIIPSDKLFAPGQTIFKQEAYSILADVRQFLLRYGDVHITVYGFSDGVYGHEEAFKITSTQARRVAAYLWESGRPFYNVASQGMANRYPVAYAKNPNASAFNRRIEISLPVIPSKAHHTLKQIEYALDIGD